MIDSRRIARVEGEVQRIVAQYLIGKMRGEIPGLLTVARVKMPADLRVAKVYVSVLGEDVNSDKVIELLQERASDIQRYIGDQLKMRYCPKLSFLWDEGTQQVLKVEGILRDLELERKGRKPFSGKE